jgi:hypothetical protein
MDGRQPARGLTAHYFFSFGCAPRAPRPLMRRDAGAWPTARRRGRGRGRGRSGLAAGAAQCARCATAACGPVPAAPLPSGAAPDPGAPLARPGAAAPRRVDVQLVGDKSNTRVEQRVLHVDVAATALKVVQKGSVRVFLRFDAINQVGRGRGGLGKQPAPQQTQAAHAHGCCVGPGLPAALVLMLQPPARPRNLPPLPRRPPQIVFDEVEPRSVLISCRDERRYFVDFQSAEDCLLFRIVCYDVSAAALDVNRSGGGRGGGRRAAPRAAAGGRCRRAAGRRLASATALPAIAQNRPALRPGVSSQVPAQRPQEGHPPEAQ